MQDQLNAGKIHPIVETLLNNGEAKLPPTGIPFNITDGVLRVQNVSVATELAKVTGNAQISLPQKRINASLNIALDPGKETLAGAEPAIRLDYSGLLASPGRTMDVTDITGYLSLRAFERERRRVERLQSNVLEKQRLRREVALYKFNDAERARAAAIEAERRPRRSVCGYLPRKLRGKRPKRRRKPRRRQMPRQRRMPRQRQQQRRGGRRRAAAARPAQFRTMLNRGVQRRNRAGVMTGRSQFGLARDARFVFNPRIVMHHGQRGRRPAFNQLKT